MRKMHEAKFKLISEAYEILKDESLRAKYDQAYKIEIQNNIPTSEPRRGNHK